MAAHTTVSTPGCGQGGQTRAALTQIQTAPSLDCMVSVFKAARGAQHVSSGLRLSANPASSTSFAHAGTENPLVVTARLFLRGGGQLRVLLTSSPPSPPSPELIPFNSCILLQPFGAGTTQVPAPRARLSLGTCKLLQYKHQKNKKLEGVSAASKLCPCYHISYKYLAEKYISWDTAAASCYNCQPK